MDKKINSRRAFLQKWLANNPPEEQIKMMTPDGKLVRVNKSGVVTTKKSRVTNKELKKWMEQKDK